MITNLRNWLSNALITLALKIAPASGGGPRPAASGVMSQKEINELFNPT